MKIAKFCCDLCCFEEFWWNLMAEIIFKFKSVVFVFVAMDIFWTHFKQLQTQSSLSFCLDLTVFWLLNYSAPCVQF